ncbi:DegT/DnrJ/EryC1/StrS family aminotransferase [Hydrogenobaculum acidophilum]
MIPFCNISLEKENIVAMVEALNPPFYCSNLKSKELGERVAQFVNRKYAVVFDNSFTAFVGILKALKLDKNDEVVLSPMSLRLNASYILEYIGLVPVYADVERWFFTIDPKRLGNVINEKTKAIIVSNSLGVVADFDAISETTTKYGIPIIEDSRETFGTIYKNKRAGAIGDISIVEFSETSFVRGKCSVVLTDDKHLYENINKFRQVIGSADSLNASITLSYFKDFNIKNQKLEYIAAFYEKHLSPIEGIKCQYFPEYVKEKYWNYFAIHLGKRYPQEARDIIVNLLIDDGIEVKPYPTSIDITLGKPLSHLHIAHDVSQRAILLPFHEGLDEEDLKFIVDRVKEHVVQVGAGSRDH